MYGGYRYPRGFYLPEETAPWTERKAEYTRLYRTVQQRLKRLESRGYTRHDTYKDFAHVLTPGQLSPSTAGQALYELTMFLDADDSTVRGYRKTVAAHVQRLHDKRNLNFVTIDNYQDFVDFMHAWRDNHSIIYDSEKATSLFGEAVKKELDPAEVEQHFNQFASEYQTLKRMPKITKRGKAVSAAEYAKLLSIEKGKRTRMNNRLRAQAAKKGLYFEDLDTSYWRKNILALEHMDVRPGATVADYKRSVSAEKRRATRARNARKRK